MLRDEGEHHVGRDRRGLIEPRLTALPLDALSQSRTNGHQLEGDADIDDQVAWGT